MVLSVTVALWHGLAYRPHVKQWFKSLKKYKCELLTTLSTKCWCHFWPRMFHNFFEGAQDMAFHQDSSSSHTSKKTLRFLKYQTCRSEKHLKRSGTWPENNNQDFKIMAKVLQQINNFILLSRISYWTSATINTFQGDFIEVFYFVQIIKLIITFADLTRPYEWRIYLNFI